MPMNPILLSPTVRAAVARPRLEEDTPRPGDGTAALGRRAGAGLAGLLLLAAVALPATASEESHYEAARALFSVAQAGEADALARAVGGMLTQIQPALAVHEDIISEFARDLVDSPDYAEAQIRVYMELFSEEELEILARLFADETFQRYRERRFELMRRSTAESMQLFRRQLPELERRIRENQPGTRQ
jgi:hypothetical protein